MSNNPTPAFPGDDFLRQLGAKLRARTLVGPLEGIRDAERAAVLAEFRRLRNLDSDPEHQRKVQEFIERIVAGRRWFDRWRSKRPTTS